MIEHIDYFSCAPPSTKTTKGLSKGSLIGLTSSRTSMQHSLTPTSGPPSTSSLQCWCSLHFTFIFDCLPRPSPTAPRSSPRRIERYPRKSMPPAIQLSICAILNVRYFSALPSLSFESRAPLTPERPKCNSILHLFGEWLFEAAHIGGDAWIQHNKSEFLADHLQKLLTILYCKF